MISSGSATRFIGHLKPAIPGRVITPPGETKQHLTPCGAPMMAILLVKPISPDFAAL